MSRKKRHTFSQDLTQEACSKDELRKRLRSYEDKCWELQGKNHDLMLERKTDIERIDWQYRKLVEMRKMSVWEFFLCKIGWSFWP